MITYFNIKKILLISCLTLTSLISSCISENLDYQDDFENSYKIWLNFKELTNNTYKYIIVDGIWPDSSWETSITVSDGKIIQRHFKYITIEGLENIPEKSLEWTENENEIGSHEYTSADLLTLEDVYEKAQQEWLIKRNNAKIYFEAKHNGLISTCGYIETTCADDCFIGIRIKSIEVL